MSWLGFVGEFGWGVGGLGLRVLFCPHPNPSPACGRGALVMWGRGYPVVSQIAGFGRVGSSVSRCTSENSFSTGMP